MEIKYSQHIISRLRIREIEYELPKIIFEQSKERYYDMKTGYMVAVMNADLFGKIREVMVAYVMEDEDAKLLTIHPLKEGQKENREKSRRWRKL